MLVCYLNYIYSNTVKVFFVATAGYNKNIRKKLFTFKYIAEHVFVLRMHTSNQTYMRLVQCCTVLLCTVLQIQAVTIGNIV